MASAEEGKLIRMGRLRARCDEVFICIEHGLPNPCDICAVETDEHAPHTCKCARCGVTAAPAEMGAVAEAMHDCHSIDQYRKTSEIAFEGDPDLVRAETAREEATAKVKRATDKDAADRAADRKRAAEKKAPEKVEKAIEETEKKKEGKEKKKEERKPRFSVRSLLLFAALILIPFAAVGYGVQSLGFWQIAIGSIVIGAIWAAIDADSQWTGLVLAAIVFAVILGTKHGWHLMSNEYPSAGNDRGSDASRSQQVVEGKQGRKAEERSNIVCRSNADCRSGEACWKGACDVPDQFSPAQSVASGSQADADQGSSSGNTVREQAASEILERAAQCADLKACIAVMLEAADPRSPEALKAATARLGQMNKAQRGDRKVARALNAKGLAEFKMGNTARAVDLLNEASVADPADVEILSNLGYIALQANRMEDAVAALASALLLDSRRTSTWTPIAELYVVRGKTDNAVRSLLLGYEFSGNQDKTVAHFEDKALTAEREAMRPVFVEAMRRINEVRASR
jgi:Flp pilus assembly protein TadD